MKTHGSATLVDKQWALKVTPHVMMRLKRVFSRIDPGELGTAYLSDTTENCRELLWFTDRFPLEVTPRKHLQARAREHEEREAQIELFLHPDYKPPQFKLAKPLRDYQGLVPAMVLQTGALLCGDELGLGKTVEAIGLLAEPRALPAVVVVKPHLQRQWMEKIAEFLPDLKVHILKKGTPYDLTKGPRGKKVPFPDVVITTYFKLQGWAEMLAASFNYVVFDEGQELRITTSDKYQAAQFIGTRVPFRLITTATPIYNYGDEIHSVLNVIVPDALGTRHEFLREWCSGSSQEDAGKPSRGARVKDPRALGTHLREQGLMLRRTRKDVGREIPKVELIPVHVEADLGVLDKVETSASELARIILAQGGVKPGRGDAFRAAGDFDNLLRQATGIAKAPYVAELVRMIVEGGVEKPEKVVLFGWHRAVYEIWLERLKDLKPLLYTGSESPSQKEKNKKAFLGNECDILVVSNRSGEGIDGLQYVCRTTVHGELDWSPKVQEQNIGRVARDGQADPVAAYVPYSDCGSDPGMMDILGIKDAQAIQIMDPAADLVQLIETNVEDRIKKLARAYLAQRLGSSFSDSIQAEAG